MPLKLPHTKINLACGDVFVSGHGWVNIDYVASHASVRQANLLDKLPFQDFEAGLVYSSHFLEHIPRDQVAQFLAECFRILAPGGMLRLVLPDLENLCRTYLAHRDAGEHCKANFVVLEMIDQCVRSETGGELGRAFQDVMGNLPASAEMAGFIRERTGYNLKQSEPARATTLSLNTIRTLIRKVSAKLLGLWIRVVLRLLPAAFRAQNVSLAATGERHQWLWDYVQLSHELEKAGFIDIQRCDASMSDSPEFPFDLLDLDADGLPRKGRESLYVEARKPWHSESEWPLK